MNVSLGPVPLTSLPAGRKLSKIDVGILGLRF